MKYRIYTGQLKIHYISHPPVLPKFITGSATSKNVTYFFGGPVANEGALHFHARPVLTLPIF